jgi:hypothetical protein
MSAENRYPSLNPVTIVFWEKTLIAQNGVKMKIEKDAKKLISLFNAVFGTDFNVVINSDSDEPDYRASLEPNIPNLINFANGYCNSALHEIAHWVIAGDQRRSQHDYGYWYAADGRDSEQQKLFQQLEILPQAIEKAFCEAMQRPFKASLDNLNHPVESSEIEKFEREIELKKCQLQQLGFPPRAQQFIDALSTEFTYALKP